MWYSKVFSFREKPVTIGPCTTLQECNQRAIRYYNSLSQWQRRQVFCFGSPVQMTEPTQSAH
jgi:hypothetical protein